MGLVGHPTLTHTLERAPYAALASRILVRVELKRVVQRERFVKLIYHALKSAGCAHTLLNESGLEIVRQASNGLPRMDGTILGTVMRLAVPKGLNHLPDELLQQAIGGLQGVFADRLLDEAAWALRECLHKLLMACECWHFSQLRRCVQQPQNQCDPERPWRTPEPV